MTIQIEYETERKLEIPYEKLAEKVASHILELEECPYEISVNLVITDNEEIRKVNAEFRLIDAPTDVLSFPMVDYPSPASFDFLETEEGDDCFNPDSGELMLGDIVISVARARAQAEEYGHSLKREFAFLVAHSMLHLLGYDHMTPEEAAVMEAKQEEVLQRLGITRD